MTAGHMRVFFYLFIYSLQEIRNYISLYHLLWIKLYVPLILNTRLYLVALEEYESVWYIEILNSIILNPVPYVLNCMLRFYFD